MNNLESDSQPSRIAAYDFARAVAILGMMVVNFKYLLQADESGPGWLQWLIDMLEGRPAALFVILAGVSLSLMSGGGRLVINENRFGPSYIVE